MTAGSLQRQGELRLWQAAILGLVQGVTEFIPVSSSGHLLLAAQVLGRPDRRDDDLWFDTALHFGTLLALLGDRGSEGLAVTKAMIDAVVRRQPSTSARLGRSLVLATIPAAVAGVVFRSRIRRHARSLRVAATAMVWGGIVLDAVDRLAGQGRDEYSLGMGDAVVIGIGQACALVPGVSRSGGSIAAARALGLSRPASMRFSLLLGMPIIAGAVASETMRLVRRPKAGTNPRPALAGVIAAALAGVVCLRRVRTAPSRWSLRSLAWYRVVVGVMALAWSFGSGAKPQKHEPEDEE